MKKAFMSISLLVISLSMLMAVLLRYRSHRLMI